MSEPMTLPDDIFEALRDIASYLRTTDMTRYRAVIDQNGELNGYWQCEEWLQGLHEIADECDRLRAAQPPAQAEPKCNCDMRTKLVGDGCSLCNPERWAELLKDDEQAEPSPDTEELVTDGGRNMFYEGLFDGESERDQKRRLAWANDMRAAFEWHTGNGWFDKSWHQETALWAACWRAASEQQRRVELDLTDDLIAILGRPNFMCINIANALRKLGRDIPNKAEREQAAVINFLLVHYLNNKEQWAELAAEEINQAAIEAEGKA